MALRKRYTTVTMFVLSLLLAAVVLFQLSLAAGSEDAQTGGAEAEASASASESPFEEGDPEAIEAGQALFVGELGCAGCHGQDGGGGIGPALNDDQWVYGGEAADIHETLVNGRPNGMPAFADAADDEQLWQVVAFVQSLSASE